MWQWIVDNAGVLGLLAIPVAVILAVPTGIQLGLSIRDLGRSTDELHARLRNTRGRVEWSTLKNTAIGTRTTVPPRLRDERGVEHDAISFLLHQIADGAPVLIQGAGGSGKSHLLSELHRESYVTAESASDPLIEVITLAAFRSSKLLPPTDAMKMAVRSIARRYRFSFRAVQSLVHESKVVLAFDGLDEVDPNARVELTRQLVALAARFPILVTSRPFGAANEDGVAVREANNFGRAQSLQLLPLEWTLVRNELTEAGVPVPDEIGHRGRREFCNPLNLQILLFLWKSQRIDAKEAVELLVDPTTLVHRFVAKRSPIGADPALLLAAVMSSDNEKSTRGAFTIFPVQLSGVAFTFTTILTVLVIGIFGFIDGLWVTAPALIVSVLLAGQGVEHGVASRIATLGRGFMHTTMGLIVYCALLAILAFLILHICRIASWSIQAGVLVIGDVHSFTHPGSWSLIAIMFAFLLATSMSVSSSGFAFGRYMKVHAWPTLLVFATLVAAVIIDPGALYLRFLAAYVGMTCLYLGVSLLVAWVITRTPPWRWPTLMNQLLQRGIVCRDEGLYKFTHAHIEETLLRSLASDSRTPRLLWTTFGTHWPRSLLEGRIAPLLAETSTTFDQVIWRLARRTSWSTGVTNIVAGYYQWVVVDPVTGLALVRRHMRIHPRSWMLPILGDAFDRANDPRGRRIAERILHSPSSDLFDVHWALRVLERHESFPDLAQRVESLLAKTADAEIREYLAGCLTRYQLSGEVEPSRGRAIPGTSPHTSRLTTATLAFESTPPDLETARALLDSIGLGPVEFARTAQFDLVMGLPVKAREWCDRAVDELTWNGGYDEVTEVMITAAVIGDHPLAHRWVARADQAGLRLRGRPGLARTLGVSEEDAAGRLITVEPTGVMSSKQGDEKDLRMSG